MYAAYAISGRYATPRGWLCEWGRFLESVWGEPRLEDRPSLRSEAFRSVPRRESHWTARGASTMMEM